MALDRSIEEPFSDSMIMSIEYASYAAENIQKWCTDDERQRLHAIIDEFEAGIAHWLVSFGRTWGTDV